MAEFFGDLERLVADLYPHRWWITAGVLIVLAAVTAFGYRRGWHTVIWRRRLPVAIVGTPVLALVIFIGYDLGSPLFTNKTVEEEFPFAFSAVVPPGMDRSDVEDIMAGIAKMDQDVVNEPMPGAPTPTATANPTPTPTATPTPRPGETPVVRPTPTPTPEPTPTPTSTPEPARAGPVKLKAGNLRDQDSVHKGSGQATIYRGQDGSHLLRLENLQVTNGPDLHVILSPHPNPGNQGEVKTSGYVDLGKLKGNRGNQNYPIPDNVDVAAQGSVVIYCKPFHVIFSVATLEDVG